MLKVFENVLLNKKLALAATLIFYSWKEDWKVSEMVSCLRRERTGIDFHLQMVS
jgi:hypothetical protein